MAKLTEELSRCFPAQGPIFAYMQWAHRLTHAPPILHLTSILPVWGFELCRRGMFTPEFGAPRVWFGVVAASSIGKTSALARAKKFSEEWYADHFTHEATRPRPWVSLEGSLPGVLHAISSLTDEHGRTAGILHHNEFSRVLRSEDALEPLNMIYDGENVDRNLRYLQKLADKGEDTKAIIQAPSFSAVVTTTPSAIARVVRPDTIEGGLWQRILWLRARVDQNELQARPYIDEEGKRFALDEWARWFGTMESYRLQGLSKRIYFRKEASDWLDSALFYSMREILAKETFESSVAMRASAHASNIAVIYAASRLSVHDGCVIVEADDVVRAANLVAMCMRTSFELGGALLTKTMDLSEKQRFLLHILEGARADGLPRRDLYKSFHGHLNKAQIDEVVQTLADADLIVEEVTPSRGGRPGRRLWTSLWWRHRASAGSTGPEGAKILPFRQDQTD